MYNKEYHDRWKAKNPDKYKAYLKEYRSRPEVKLRAAENQRNWRALNKERAKELDKAKYLKGREKNRINKMLSGARDRAKTKSLPFNITVEDIIIPNICPVLGIAIVSGNHDTRPELDRIIPELGYVKGNVQVISGRANRIKWNATIDELRAVVDYVSSRA